MQRMPSKENKLRTILIVPDCHHPYVDRRAWELLLKAGKLLRPDIIVSLGDFADFYQVSSHVKDPSRKERFDEEIKLVIKALEQLSNLGAKENIYISGNHEDRLSRFLATKAPELNQIVTIPSLLHLKRLRWEYVKYKDYKKVGKVYFTHDLDAAGDAAVRQAFLAVQDNIIIGHTHRFQYRIEGNSRNSPHIAASFGWLGDVNAIDYKHRLKARRDWALGFGVGHMLPSGVMHITPVPIVNYKCVVSGRLLSG